jgi:hypothetical protein
MITVPELSAEALGSFLTSHLGRRFSSTEGELAELVPSVARLALECIGNSDALYHNVEHTMLVTLVGYDIMKCRALLTPTSPADFAHVLVACLLHDIGYVRGILEGDGPDGYVVDGQGRRTKLPRGSSDAALLMHHVDRSKLFVMDRIGSSDLLDAARIARSIEFTRVPAATEPNGNGSEEGELVPRRSLGNCDPQPTKANALYEFEVGPTSSSIRVARRPHGFIPVLLKRFALHPDQDPLSRDVEWPLWMQISGNVFRAGAIFDRRGRSDSGAGGRWTRPKAARLSSW